MKGSYLDLHIHIGRSNDGKAVKITASRNLTLENILKECLEKKGIDLIGIVDCASSGVLQDIKELIAQGELSVLDKGGLRYRDRLTLFTGVELETRELGGGQAHYLSFFPKLENLQRFADFVAQKVKNPQLSSQACHMSARELMDVVLDMEGIFIPAHVFTPHKSLFGSCASSLGQVFGSQAPNIRAIELGLSADSQMAHLLPELDNKVFLTNSDAHSLEKIGREYNRVYLKEPNFEELNYMLMGLKGRKILANYGLDPRLGKYHRSYCLSCQRPLTGEGATFTCSCCGEERNIVLGVLDRILSISPLLQSPSQNREDTVPYYYQVPLYFLPGLGRKRIEKLLARFGTEMNILHDVEEGELAEVIGREGASLILKARRGELKYLPGAGGIYGKVDIS